MSRQCHACDDYSNHPVCNGQGSDTLGCPQIAVGIGHGLFGLSRRREPRKTLGDRERRYDPLLDRHFPDPFEFRSQRRIGARTAAEAGKFRLCLRHGGRLNQTPLSGKLCTDWEKSDGKATPQRLRRRRMDAETSKPTQVEGSGTDWKRISVTPTPPVPPPPAPFW